MYTHFSCTHKSAPAAPNTWHSTRHRAQHQTPGTHRQPRCTEPRAPAGPEPTCRHSRLCTTGDREITGGREITKCLARMEVSPPQVPRLFLNQGLSIPQKSLRTGQQFRTAACLVGVPLERRSSAILTPRKAKALSYFIHVYNDPVRDGVTPATRFTEKPQECSWSLRGRLHPSLLPTPSIPSFQNGISFLRRQTALIKRSERAPESSRTGLCDTD